MLPTYLGVFLLSMASLAFEITLTRVFSVAQWYHFAFMTVSIALLGFGASGSFLALFPSLANGPHPTSFDKLRTTPEAGAGGRGGEVGQVGNLSHRAGTAPGSYALLAVLFALSVLGSYLTINYIPFDSYRIAWERRQLLYLAIYYLSLALPFFFSGLIVGALLAAQPARASTIYASNLAGSALGCLVAVAALPFLGGAGTVMLSAFVGWLAVAAFAWPRRSLVLDPRSFVLRPSSLVPTSIAYLMVLIVLLAFTLSPPGFLNIRLSPYKGLSYALQYPGAEIVFSRWNAFSRIDVVRSGGIHSAPGLSLAYLGSPPSQLGLFTDGENLSPITATDWEEAELREFIGYLPTSLPYRLLPGAEVLIIEPKGGLDVLTALENGAASVVAVESNPLIVEAVRDSFQDGWLSSDLGRVAEGVSKPAYRNLGGIYQDARVTVITEEGRSHVRRMGQKYDLIQLSLADSYRPVTSGAYSLSENYLYTQEAFADYLAHLNEGGLLVVSRWLQLPPSEALRVGALAVAALEKIGVTHPERRLVVIRSMRTALLLVKNGEFSTKEIEAVRGFCEENKFDLVYYPGIQPAEANRYNVLPERSYYRAFQDLLSAEDRAHFYADYVFDVSPPDDDRPFFFHFFKWSQTPAILQTFGKTWQPFGGSGYFVLVALLVLALLASAVLILLPLLFQRKLPTAPSSRGKKTGGVDHKSTTRRGRSTTSGGSRGRVFLYFALLGLGYLFVEIPLMQRFILFLGHPIYAFATTLFALLLFSGLGSMTGPRLSLPQMLIFLVVAILLYPLLLPHFFQLLLGQSFALRMLASVVSLAPLGFLMGIPFPGGIALLDRLAPDLIPWAWGINGCLSVLASILSTMLAISFGFSWVLVGASLAYAGGAVVIWRMANSG
ncbi:MAG: hypothetical protein GTN71_23400 [Anaerolineae bacterium]|nr:hypothetical protein [Anaerolineae bacterium]